jgi:hypothetical protein
LEFSFWASKGKDFYSNNQGTIHFLFQFQSLFWEVNDMATLMPLAVVNLPIQDWNSINPQSFPVLPNLERNWGKGKRKEDNDGMTG